MVSIVVGVQEMILRNVGLSAAVANIWFVDWAIRHKGELDHELDSTAKLIRWLVAIASLGMVAQFPRLLNLPPFRVCVGLVGIGFLVWPNLAFYLAPSLTTPATGCRRQPRRLGSSPIRWSLAQRNRCSVFETRDVD